MCSFCFVLPKKEPHKTLVRIAYGESTWGTLELSISFFTFVYHLIVIAFKFLNIYKYFVKCPR